MNIRVLLSISLAALIVVYAATLGMAPLAAQQVPQVNPVKATPDSLAAGQKTYQRYCRVCHGAEGKGGAKLEEGPEASNLIDDKWDHGATDSAMFYVIKNGIPPEMVMAAWEEQLSDTEIWNVVNYVRSLAPKK